MKSIDDDTLNIEQLENRIVSCYTIIKILKETNDFINQRIILQDFLEDENMDIALEDYQKNEKEIETLKQLEKKWYKELVKKHE